MPTEAQTDLLQQSDQLYAQYVQPLEQEHWGQYVAVAADGTLVMAETLPAVMEKAEHDLQAGSFLFKVGDVAVDKRR